MILLKNARVPLAVLPDDLDAAPECASTEPWATVDIAVTDNVITAVTASGSGDDAATPGAEVIDLGGRIVFPGFLDAHTHLDKAHSWDRAPNRRGEFWDAIQILSDDKANWTEEDLYKRATFTLRCAEAYGSVAVRTHVDTGPEFGKHSHEVMNQLRSEWAGRIELQTVSLCGVENYSEPGCDYIVDSTLAHPAACLGGMPQMNPDLDKQLDRLFAIASERNAGIDLHVDENGLAEAEVLRHVALAKIRNDFHGPVTCGHCCSLSIQPRERQMDTIRIVAEAGVHVISLPLCNMYLQDRTRDENERPGTPKWRGVTMFHELMDAGVTVATASDNVRDAFYAYGDLDMFEVYLQTVRIAHLDRCLDRSVKVATANPAAIMRCDTFGSIEPGKAARFVVFQARTFSELLSRPTQRRSIFRNGTLTELAVPDYSELDLSA